MIGIVQHSNA